MSVRKRVSWLAVLTVAACGAGAGPAAADLTFEALGNPVDADSWYQPFRVSSDESFQHIGLVVMPFDPTSGFDADAWDFDAMDGNVNGFAEAEISRNGFGIEWTVASGNATQDLLWRSHFEGSREQQSFFLTLFAFNDTLDSDVATAQWNGRSGSWDFGPHASGITWDQFKNMGGVASIVPAPPAAFLALVGLGLVGAITRRSR